MGPFLIPQVAQLVTGKSVKDPEFLAQREEFLRALGRRIGAPERPTSTKRPSTKRPSTERRSADAES
jgi:hypothetical protein